MNIRNKENSQGLPLRILDLFAGTGGLSLGFEKFNGKIGRRIYEFAGAVEVDHDACETLRKNHPALVAEEENALIFEGDLTSVEIHDKVVKRVGKSGVDIIVGGPPCQSFSMIGTRSGRWVEDKKFENDRRDLLFMEYVALVRQLQPLFVVLENVDGIRSKKDKQGQTYLSRIIGELERLGYRFEITGHDEKFLRLNAADFGVPQIRNRIFLVGNRMGITLSPPTPTHFDPNGSGVQVEGRLPWVTLWDAIGDLPQLQAHFTRSNITLDEWEERKKENESRYNGANGVPFHEKRFARHYESLGKQGKAFLDFVAASHGLVLRYHRAREQQVSDIELFEKMPEGATAKNIFEGPEELRVLSRFIRYDMESFKDKYRKQQWKRPSTTIFAHLERDGNRFIHPDSSQARTFTVREAARIQSFPDDYLIAGAMKKQYRQIGNAVPPLLARAIAEAIYQSLVASGHMIDGDGVVAYEEDS
ncbi:MAG: DNA cytosine methyltransferase [Firmicutes bacterium]|nr:DNA cytosine methyltransferase [Bacillota bacterium]